MQIINEVPPVVPVAAMQPSSNIPEIGGSNVQRIAGSTQFLVDYKDQTRSVQESVLGNQVPFADVAPAVASRIERDSVNA